MPDIFLWLISNGKRYAYYRLPARSLIYSVTEEECGLNCGKVQTVFLRLPGKHSVGPGGWGVQAKLEIYLWLGVVGHKGHFCDKLPAGYDISNEIRNAKRLGALAPRTLHYLNKTVNKLNFINALQIL